MKYSLTTLKCIVILCFMASATAMAQSQEKSVFPLVTETTVPVTATDKSAAEIAPEVNVSTNIKEQLAETKIQKRRRKKQDPILIPYRLNKKNSCLS